MKWLGVPKQNREGIRLKCACGHWMDINQRFSMPHEAEWILKMARRNCMNCQQRMCKP